jgi:hypothetical protein
MIVTVDGIALGAAGVEAFLHEGVALEQLVEPPEVFLVK